jgi:hypothetical protein
MTPGSTPGSRTSHHLTTTRQRRVDNRLKLGTPHGAAHDHHLGAGCREQHREVLDVAERSGRARPFDIHEPDRLEFARRAERRAGRDCMALPRPPHEQSCRRVAPTAADPGDQPIDQLALDHQYHPYDHDSEHVLGGHELHAAGPDRHPQRQSGRQRARNEEPARVAPPVTRAVVPGHEQPGDERRGELPAVQNPGGHHVPHDFSDPCPQDGQVADQPDHAAQRGERGEVGEHEHNRARDGALDVATKIAGRPLLQAEPDRRPALAASRDPRVISGRRRTSERRRRPRRQGRDRGPVRGLAARQGLQRDAPVRDGSAPGSQATRSGRTPNIRLA